VRKKGAEEDQRRRKQGINITFGKDEGPALTTISIGPFGSVSKVEMD
jgi:hypothetical protein